MSGKIARKYFLGQGGRRLGCAEAVAEALRVSYDLKDGLIRSMASARGGKAPLGYCGAVHAAITIIERKDPQKKQRIEDFFKKEAGGLTCREIRSAGRLMCADCVEKAAELLSEPDQC